MQNLMTLVRAFHFASLISLAGALAFTAFVTEPVFPPATATHAG